MLRRIVTVALGLIGLFSLPVSAQDGADRVLKIVPADAVAVLAAPNVGQLDQDFQQTVNALGLGMLLQPPANSIISMLEQASGMAGGINGQGPVAIVVMPLSNVYEITSKVAMIVPATDPKKLLEQIGAQAGEGGLYSATMHGMPMTATTTSSHVILAMTPDVVKAVASPSGTMDGRVPAEDKGALSEADLFLWIDAEKLGPLVKSQMDGFFAMAAMGAPADPATKTQLDAQKQQMTEILDGARSALLAVRLKSEGLGLRFGFTAKPGSEFGNKLKPVAVTGSLLRGLPGGPYMVAAGGAVDREQIKANLAELDPMFLPLNEIPDAAPDQVTAFKNTFKALIGSIGFGSVKMEALPAGDNGIFGVGVYLETEDSGKFITDLTQLVAAGKALTTHAEYKPALDAVTHTPDAETVAGAKVHHLKFDVSQLDDADEDDIEEMNAILGKDGLALRFAASDANNVLFTFGGGSAYLEKFLAQAKAGGAPLDSDAGITKVTTQTPADPYTVSYIAVDQIIECVKSGARALEDEELPIDMPPLNAPAAMTLNVGEGWSQFDLYLPMELIVAGKNAIMAMTMYSADEENDAAPAEGEGAAPSDGAEHDHADHEDHEGHDEDTGNE